MALTMGEQEAVARMAALEHASKFADRTHETSDTVLVIARKYLNFLMDVGDKPDEKPTNVAPMRKA